MEYGKEIEMENYICVGFIQLFIDKWKSLKIVQVDSLYVK